MQERIASIRAREADSAGAGQASEVHTRRLSQELESLPVLRLLLAQIPDDVAPAPHYRAADRCHTAAVREVSECLSNTGTTGQRGAHSPRADMPPA